VTSKPDFKVMVLLLVFMQLTRDLFAIAKFLLSSLILFTVKQTNKQTNQQTENIRPIYLLRRR